MVFCFFMLWLSFTANIRENSWEYGVLRALGLTASTVLRLYIYEAIVIVLSCLILGYGHCLRCRVHGPWSQNQTFLGSLRLSGAATGRRWAC